MQHQFQLSNVQREVDRLNNDRIRLGNELRKGLNPQSKSQLGEIEKRLESKDGEIRSMKQSHQNETQLHTEELKQKFNQFKHEMYFKTKNGLQMQMGMRMTFLDSPIASELTLGLPTDASVHGQMPLPQFSPNFANTPNPMGMAPTAINQGMGFGQNISPPQMNYPTSGPSVYNSGQGRFNAGQMSQQQTHQ